MAINKRFLAKNGLDNNSNTIVNVSDPVNAQDVSTKAFSSNATNLASGTISTARLGSGTADSTTYLRGDNTWQPNNIISANSSTDAFRITQTGTGNALVVEDSANPDSTPFVVDANGNVGIGTATATERLNLTSDGRNFLQMTRASTDSNQSVISIRKSRGTNAAPTTVASGDAIGDTQYYGHDGAAFIQAASIIAAVDGTPGLNDMPGRLVFSTTADGASTPTERMRIDSVGDVTVTGNIKIPDNKNLYIGTGNDLYAIHDGTNTSIINQTGILSISSTAAGLVLVGANGSNFELLSTAAYLDATTSYFRSQNGATTYAYINSTGVTSQNNTDWPLRTLSTSATITSRGSTLQQRSISGGAVTTNTMLGGLSIGGHNGTSLTSGWNGGAELLFTATQDWGSTANGTKFTIGVSANGATSPTTRLTIDQDGTTTVNGALTVSGNLTINGTTTTVNSTTMTVDDPIITLGGDTAPAADDNKDRGIEFRYHNGTAAKVGFFGYDDSTGKLTFIPDATNTSEVFSGTQGTISANVLESTVATGTAPLTVTSTTAVTNLNADMLDGKHVGTSGNAVPLMDGTNTWSGTQTFSTGVNPGAMVYPIYEANVDFGADVANTWRKIVSASLFNGTYSTVGFIIEVIDPQVNHATSTSVNSIIKETYHVACVRTENTTVDTPDACYVSGPGSRIRAIKTAVGAYEIQIQTAAQYREYKVRISTYASNQPHTINYFAGGTIGTATATYTSATGASVDYFQNITVTGTILGNGLTAGSTSVSFVEYNGTTKTAGQWDGGTTAPSSTTRLNYDGYLYATGFYGDGSNLTGTFDGGAF